VAAADRRVAARRGHTAEYDRGVSTNARLPLILDVDTGIDDSLAILYACASPDAELLAVTCLSGNVAAQDVQRNTRAVLELAGRTDVEVALGREQPLLRPLDIAPDTHGPHGVGYAVLPDPTLPLSPRYAASLIVEEARRRPGEITLVTLGPLTNLAIAVLAEPRLPSLLRRWGLMGGSYRVPGNTTPTTEWNIHCDPEAARICFSAWAAAVEQDEGVPRPLALGLDVTETAKLTPDHVVELARRAGSTPDDSLDPDREPGSPERRSVASNPVVRFVADALRFYMEFHASYDGFYGAFVHDPLATAAALDPTLVRTRAVAVDVDASGGVADGQTVADWRGLWRRTPNVDVAVEADAAEFLRRWIERVGVLAAGRSDVAR
jgi:purine nucleosidase